jgi:hypothetical protein
MLKVWSIISRYLRVRQLFVAFILLVAELATAEITPKIRLNRRPASYVPDDEVIVKPVDNELSFYQQYVATDNSSEVVNFRNQLKVWNDNQQFADQYGLNTSLAGSAFYVPTPDEKLQYFKDRYMRYLKRKGEGSFRDVPKNWYRDFRASNEVDTIDEMEARFKETTKSSKSQEDLPTALQQKEISLWKQTKFIFQPRVEQGLIVVGIRGPIAYARAWVGVNGETEINIQKNIDSIGFRMMFNYYAHTGKYFTSIDQRLMENIYARVISQKDPTQFFQDETLMLLYAKQF